MANLIPCNSKVYVPRDTIVYSQSVEPLKLMASYMVTLRAVDIDYREVMWKNSYGDLSGCKVDDLLLSYNPELMEYFK